MGCSSSDSSQSQNQNKQNQGSNNNQTQQHKNLKGKSVKPTSGKIKQEITRKSGVKELVTIHIGNCGISLGESFWGHQCIENGIGLDGVFYGDGLHKGEYLSTYFDEMKDGRFQPRSVFVDTDCSSIDELNSFYMKDLFRNVKRNGPKEPCATFARGYYTIGKDKALEENIEEQLRICLEKHDNLDGALFFSSLSGGAGSGLLTSMTNKWQDKTKKSALGIHIIPSERMGNDPLDSYNSILSLSM